ncbi:MAG: hypothetical protein ACYCPP_04310 [Nitrososphaerales archaeon]
MTIRKTRDISESLSKKGFEVSQGDHRFFVLHVGGKKTSIWTKVSHGGKEVGDSLIHMMSAQLRLDKKQFLDLVDCPMTREAYLEELKKQGFL